MQIYVFVWLYIFWLMGNLTKAYKLKLIRLTNQIILNENYKIIPMTFVTHYLIKSQDRQGVTYTVEQPIIGATDQKHLLPQ